VLNFVVIYIITADVEINNIMSNSTPTLVNLCLVYGFCM